MRIVEAFVAGALIVIDPDGNPIMIDQHVPQPRR